MKRKNQQRILFARAAMIALAASGIAAGCLLGYVLAPDVAESWLDQYAKFMQTQYDASAVEVRSLQTTLKSSQYSYCSDAEIAYFRDLVFRSEYLKDAGRIRGGKIECSAKEGHSMRSIAQFRPDALQTNALQKDGATAYANLVPLQDPSLKRAGLQLGSVFVVFSSQAPASGTPIPMQLTVTMKDPAGQQSGRLQTGTYQAQEPNKGPNLTTDGQLRVGDMLYATRCSTLHSECVTAYTPVSETLPIQASMVKGCMLLGGATGVLLGLVFSVIHRRGRSMEQQLRRAVARNELQVAYQPIVSLATGRIVGAEALARWTDEDGVEVGPEVFVKVAEEHGFIGALTKLVIQRAVNAFQETLRTRPEFRLSVNVAAADLADPAFLPMLDDTLMRTKVQAKNLVIEITESSTANREVAMEAIRSLRRRGHRIHIDDFGTGYSSLSYLLYLAVDTIKIDKAFTRAIGTESVTVAILPQILAMAESLKLEVVVEGVETGRQADYFSASGQPVYGQGWLYGRPVPAEEFHGLLADDWTKALVPADTTVAQPVEPGVMQIVGERAVRIDTRRIA